MKNRENWLEQSLNFVVKAKDYETTFSRSPITHGQFSYLRDRRNSYSQLNGSQKRFSLCFGNNNRILYFNEHIKHCQEAESVLNYFMDFQFYILHLQRKRANRILLVSFRTASQYDMFRLKIHEHGEVWLWQFFLFGSKCSTRFSPCILELP